MTEQEKEIATIKERTIKLKLSDADAARITERAEGCGLTVAQLLENFIGDLVAGTYSNGSDERERASSWFNRCWFGMFPDETFITWVINNWYSETIFDTLKFMEDMQADINLTNEELNNPAYNWADIETYDRNTGKYIQYYKSREEWETEQKKYIKECTIDAENAAQELKEYIAEYNESSKEKIDFEAAIKELKEYRERTKDFLNAE